jgi:mannose-6-phosphate isomerase
MSSLYPLLFHPIFKERIWGGRSLQNLYGKPLPPDKRIGESWEITDRAEGVSVIANGDLAGKSLRWLMETERKALLGSANSVAGRFPLLIKILDAQDRLSLQVHPPAWIAPDLKGEPKTELWYIAQAAKDAELYVGLQREVTPQEFERRLSNGSVAECFHRIPVRAGDAMFLPSGRVHAIGAGNIIFEVQQNSDTTFRVFDWNRTDAEGNPRQLHVKESLQCIHFEDYEPGLVQGRAVRSDGLRITSLVEDPAFSVELIETESSRTWDCIPDDRCRILGVVEGSIAVRQETGPQPSTVTVNRGQFCLLPASLGLTAVQLEAGSKVLAMEPGR